MKPGIKTTEFWITVALIAVSLGAAVLGQMDAEWAVSLAAILALAYKIGRILLKLRGFDTTDADALRTVIQQEIGFIMADKQKALPVDPQ